MENGPVPVAAPRCVLWFKVYAGAIASLYLLGTAGLLFLTFHLPEVKFVPLVLATLLCGAIFLGVVPALFLRPSPASWTYDLVLICLGLGSCPAAFAAIPLLLFWIKPETKAFFGKR